MKASRVLVAIPAFNEALTISDVVTRVRQSLPEFDLLVINDGSADRTEELLSALGVTTAARAKIAPEVPAIAESGVP